MIGIRVDSNGEIALGHVMRCLSIANRLNKDVIFICSENSTKKIVEKKGYRVICLYNQYNQKENELSKLCKIIIENNIEILLVDSYQITQEYFKILHEITKLVYIDDMNMFHYDVDMIINYTYETSMESYKKWNYVNTIFLLGSEYIPLREQFRNKCAVIDNVKEVFISTGGTDNYHIILDLVKKLVEKRYRVNIVVGKYYGDYEKLRELSDQSKLIYLYQNVNNVADIMLRCDIAISAGGTTLAELATLGIPTICFAIADNQLEGTKKYSENGLMVYAGDVREGRVRLIDKIIVEFEELAKNKSQRLSMSKKMKNIFDGLGAERIARHIEKL